VSGPLVVENLPAARFERFFSTNYQKSLFIAFDINTLRDPAHG